MMIKDLINIELKDLPIEGLDIHIIKKYEILTSEDESFTTNNLTVLLLRSGGFKIKLNEITQALSPKDLIIIPKDSFCTLFEVSEHLQFYLINFSSEFAVQNCLKKELVDSFYFFIRKEPLKTSLAEKEYMVLSLIYKLIYFVNLEAKRVGYDGQLQRISLNLFLYELKLIYTRYTANALVNFSRKEDLVIQFLTILSIHYKKQHHVKFYAGALFVTAGYLNKTVKEVTGKNIKALIIEALISECKILLEDSQFTIAEIAEEMEFVNASVFGIFFKKHTSYSPTEYRSNSIERFKSR
ncbi:MAG: helix-turn-helix domain-containing protein [Flavobacterium sp.]